MCCLDGENLVGSGKEPVFVVIATYWRGTMKLQVSTFTVLRSTAADS